MHVSDISQLTSSPQDIQDLGCTSCNDLQAVQRTGGLGALESADIQRLAVIAAVLVVGYMVVR